MKFFLLCFALVGIATASIINQEELDAQFSYFKSRFERSYGSVAEENARKSIFATNLEFIVKHNIEASQGLKTFTVGVNNFTDMTNGEFRRFYNGFRSTYLERNVPTFDEENVEGLPATVDWTTKGLVTPIKNQQQCGSCWAFSTVASIEGQHARKTGKLVSLSEQQLVDCSGPEGDNGCEGGLMDNGFNYVIVNHGLDTEASYPYKAIDEKCVFKKKDVGATITSYVDVKKGSEAALQKAVATVGPISIAIDASQMSFQFYASGVYIEPACSTMFLDHGVTAVGYGTLNGQAYWKVKNSWGADWGEKGYILMARNKHNQCGVASQASYPVV